MVLRISRNFYSTMIHAQTGGTGCLAALFLDLDGRLDHGRYFRWFLSTNMLSNSYYIWILSYIWHTYSCIYCTICWYFTSTSIYIYKTCIHEYPNIYIPTYSIGFRVLLLPGSSCRADGSARQQVQYQARWESEMGVFQVYPPRQEHSQMKV